MRVRKAVFPVGGWGTRFMPATKAIPKALFPIVDKPIIHYAVEEAVDSGIEQIIFVITPNNQAIEDYFSRSLDLESFLERKKRDDLLTQVRKLSGIAYFCSTRSERRSHRPPHSPSRVLAPPHRSAAEGCSARCKDSRLATW